MLPTWCIALAIVIRLVGGGQYAWAVWRGKARPNPVTWLLWGATAMIAFAAQLHEGVGSQALITFALGLGPLVIFILAIWRHPLASHLTLFTISCAVFAVIGIILWRVTDNAELAIFFSIVADIFASLPTLRKAYHDPSSEYGWPYFLSVISMTIVLLTVQVWTFAVVAFPLYMLCINVLLLAFAIVPLKRMRKQSRSRRVRKQR